MRRFFLYIKGMQVRGVIDVINFIIHVTQLAGISVDMVNRGEFESH